MSVLPDVVVESEMLEARPSDGRRKVAIVGWSGTSRDLAPWEDRTWEKWALNTMAQHPQYGLRMDRLYQLHDAETTRADLAEDPAFWKWCCENTIVPLYMHAPQPEFPMAVQYPTDEILKSFRDYFTNSVSWMIALAIHEGVDVLGVWGVDMANANGEYAAQRPSCEYYLGLAEGRGIEVVLPPESDLCRTCGQYGLVNDNKLYKALQVRIDEMNARMNECMQGQNQNAMTISKLQGGVEVAAYFQSAWCLPQAKES